VSDQEIKKGHGGRRAGAGRPKQAVDGCNVAAKADMTPLEYMLEVMRDPRANKARRDRMAVAAAPFCHERMADNRVGKKEVAAMAAQNPDAGSALGELMGQRQDHLN
jgi:hypothetical protein